MAIARTPLAQSEGTNRWACVTPDYLAAIATTRAAHIEAYENGVSDDGRLLPVHHPVGGLEVQRSKTESRLPPSSDGVHYQFVGLTVLMNKGVVLGLVVAG